MESLSKAISVLTVRKCEHSSICLFGSRFEEYSILKINMNDYICVFATLVKLTIDQYFLQLNWLIMSKDIAIQTNESLSLISE